MRTSTARSNGWRCPRCGDETSRDESGQGYVRHRTNSACDFEKGLRDGGVQVSTAGTPAAVVSVNARGGQGQETDVLGRWVTEYVRSAPALRGYEVFYDHGDSRESNVVAIKGFYGSQVTNLNRLADVDVMVVAPDQRVLLLVEIEERGSSPKKIIGDAVTIMMCNRFAVRQSGAQRYFEIAGHTRLIVSGVMPGQGNRLDKVDHVIVPRFRQMSGFSDGIDSGKVEFIFEPSIVQTVDRLKRIIREVLPF